MIDAYFKIIFTEAEYGVQNRVFLQRRWGGHQNQRRINLRQDTVDSYGDSYGNT